MKGSKLDNGIGFSDVTNKYGASSRESRFGQASTHTTILDGWRDLASESRIEDVSGSCKSYPSWHVHTNLDEVIVASCELQVDSC